MRPLGFIWLVIIAFAIIGVPLAFLIDREGVFFALVARVGTRHIIDAYIWTLISVVILIASSYVLGTNKNQSVFLSRPIKDLGQSFYVATWLVSITASAIITVVTFVSAGFSIPLFDLLSDPTGYLLLRAEARANISQALLNLNLIFFCPLSVCVAAFFIQKRRHLLLFTSIANIVLVASFSLAKSPVAMAFFVIIIFYSCMRPINLAKLAKYGVVLLAVLIPLFLASASGRVSWAGDRGVVEIVGGRVVYGQWAGLPYFFEIYENKRAALGTLKPSYLRDSGGDRWSHRGEESPARQAMRLVTGYRDLERAGVGVAVTFFIGEAYAVWGRPGIVFASIFVAFQMFVLSLVFVHWPRTLWTMFLYSWFVYKMAIGVITGFSAFMFSSSTYLLFVLALITLFARSLRQLDSKKILSSRAFPPRDNAVDSSV